MKPPVRYQLGRGAVKPARRPAAGSLGREALRAATADDTHPAPAGGRRDAVDMTASSELGDEIVERHDPDSRVERNADSEARNMQNMMKQAQKMQADMARVQEELADERVEASVGGGAVKVVMTGDLMLESVQHRPRARSTPTTSRCSQDLIVAAP